MTLIQRFKDSPHESSGAGPVCIVPQDGRALVAAGGGAWGSVATGMLLAWQRDYAAAAGISTGNLIAPIALGGQYDQLVEAYTNVDLKAIFSVSPFTKKGKVRVLHALKRLALRKGSLGEMEPLKQLIREFYPLNLHYHNIQTGKIGLCGALNLCHEPHELELFRTDRDDYDTFTAAMYASCCFWPVAEVARIGKKQYVDGGFVETLLIAEMISLGYRTIDVITLRPRHEEKVSMYPTRRFVETAKRILTAIRYDTVYENLNRAIALAARRDDVTINVYHTPQKLSDNAMYFNKQQMRDWVKLGEDLAFDERYVDTY